MGLRQARKTSLSPMMTTSSKARLAPFHQFLHTLPRSKSCFRIMAFLYAVTSPRVKRELFGAAS